MILLTLCPELAACPSFAEYESTSIAIDIELLRLYAEETCSYTVSGPPDFYNPFLHEVLPMAFSDHLILDAVLALGGMSARVSEESDIIETRALECYGAAMHQLRIALAAFTPGDDSEAVRLFVATMLLCLHEVCYSFLIMGVMTVY